LAHGRALVAGANMDGEPEAVVMGLEELISS
jgi:hypothetical protein